MQTHKEQSPRQDLPNEGTALPSKRTKPEGELEQSSSLTNSMATARTRKSKDTQAAFLINDAIKTAHDIVNNESIDELEWLVAFRTWANNSDIRTSDTDLRRYLRQAKANRDGRKDFIDKDQALDLREEEWLLQGVIMRQATNMIFALPKVGKTRFILAMLSDLLKGRGEFAGIGLFPGKERLLLLGPDQSQRSWGNYLKRADLLTDDNKLMSSIVGMVTAETGFSLDDYWLTKIEAKLREHGPLIVVLDCYSAAIRMEALDENKPEATIPLQKLHNIVMAYDSTLIVIHHSNKNGGDGDVSKMARGSSAITAAADNLIGMRKWEEQEETGVKKYELLVTGRAETDGAPLIGYEKHTGTWVSCGSASDAREALTKDGAYDSLTIPHLAALDALVSAHRKDKSVLTTKQIVDIAVPEPKKNSNVVMNKTLRSLESKGFITQVPPAPGSPVKAAFRWAPTAWAMVKHQEMAL